MTNTDSARCKPPSVTRAGDRGYPTASLVSGGAAQLPARRVPVRDLARPATEPCERRGSASLSDRAERGGLGAPAMNTAESALRFFFTRKLTGRSRLASSAG